jgi:hypothetical protein
MSLEKARGRSRGGLGFAVTVIAAAVFMSALILWPREPIPEPSVSLPAAKVPETLQLRVHAHPWAEVFLDGESKGFTPRAEPFEVEEGKHTLVLRNPHLGERSIEVELEAGRTEAISVNLLEDGR